MYTNSGYCIRKNDEQKKKAYSYKTVAMRFCKKKEKKVKIKYYYEKAKKKYIYINDSFITSARPGNTESVSDTGLRREPIKWNY